MASTDLRTAKQLDEIKAMRELGHRLILPCQRCIGGQVIANQCIHCGAEYTPDGELLIPKVTGEDPRYERHFHWNKRALKG